MRDATESITLKDLIDYGAIIWSSGKGEALIQGNYDESEAFELVKNIGEVLPFRPIKPSEYPLRLEALPLPIQDASTNVPLRLVISEPNFSNENSVSHVTLQNLGKSEKDHMLMEILSSVVNEPFYNELRTKKQLGYIVASGVKGIAETRSISFIVQSSVAPANKLTNEILSFLDNVESTILQKLSKGTLAVYVKSLVEKKTEPEKELAGEVTRNWSEIASGRMQFDRQQREAAACLEIEKSDVLEFWQRLFGKSTRRALITEMVPRQGIASSDIPLKTTQDGESTTSAVLGIDDIDIFRQRSA